MTEPAKEKRAGSAEAGLQRWRLVLGRFAEPCLGPCGGPGSKQWRMDRVLDYLYGREYRGRGVRARQTTGADGESRSGGQEESVLAIPEWIQQVRELFPADTSEIIQRHALDRYGMTELVTDPEVLEKLEPSYELLKAVLSFKGMMHGPVLEVARKIVRQVVEDLCRRLAKDVRQTLDDDALAALANKGLLRRAKKDLEGATPSIEAVEDGLVKVAVGDVVVQLPGHPAGSACTCPAAGVCRHVLAALLYVRDDPQLTASESSAQPGLDGAADSPQQIGEPAGSPLPSPAEVFANLDEKALQKWAGKTLLRKAMRFVAGDQDVEIEAGAALVVRFPQWNVTCRWIPSGELTGMLCSCPAETVCEHAVAAVIAYQVSLGKRQIQPEQTVLQQSTGAPRSRAEVLESVGGVLREMVSLGLARLSLATAARLTTLAVSAHGVDLPRLERMLKSLADEIHLALRRDAQTSAARLLSLAGRIEALRFGLINSQSASLVGQHRSRYFEVGHITLIGLGAQHWRSQGGYHGLTVHFWDQSRGAWATWSESRPVNQAGFSPAGRYFGEGPWAGCSSPEEADLALQRRADHSIESRESPRRDAAQARREEVRTVARCR